jgi:hypothetical protein
MRNDPELFEKLMRTFKFSQPVPPETRRRLSSNKKKQFMLVLKKSGGYTIIFGLIASLFFSLKKLGLGVTIAKTAVILALGTSAVVGLISLGVYTSVKDLMLKDVRDGAPPTEESGEAALPVSNTAAGSVATDSAIHVAQWIGIGSISADSARDPESRAARKALVDELTRLRGKDYTIAIDERGGDRRYRMVLAGSIEARGEAYIISARISDVRDSRLLYYTSEEAASKELIPGACAALAKRIARALPVTTEK